MTGAEVAKIAAYVTASWSNQELSPELAKLWLRDFAQADYAAMREAVDGLRRTSPMMPSTSDLLAAHRGILAKRPLPKLGDGRDEADRGVLYWVIRERRNIAQLSDPEHAPLTESQLVEQRFRTYREARTVLSMGVTNRELIAVFPEAEEAKR